MKKTILILVSVLTLYVGHTQNVGINNTGANPVDAAALDVDMPNKGVLLPRVALTTATSFAPVTGTATTSLLIYNTATAGAAPNNVTPGYYYWNGSRWMRVNITGDNWGVVGNSGLNAAVNFIGTTDNVDLVARVNNAERFRIVSATGNVGIGNNNPSNRLTVNGGNVLLTDAAGTGGFIQGFDEHHSIYFREGSQNRTNYYQFGGTVASGSGHRFLTGGLRLSQTLKLQIADDAVYSSIPIGIGNMAPFGAFDVVMGGANGWSYFRSNVGTSNPSAGFNTGLAIGWNKSGGLGETNLIYSTGIGGATGLEIGEWNGGTYNARMKIVGGNGQVGIGTTTPATKLDVIGLHVGAGNGTGGNNDAPSQVAIPGGFNGVARQNDWPNGWGGGLSTYDICGMSAFMSGYITRSDRRLKNTINTMNTSVVQSFMNLRPVTYYMNEQTPEIAGLQYGFIAQEVSELFPSLVTTSTDPNGTIGMNYQGLIAPTVYVVQEQQKKIDALESELKELKAMMLQLMEKQK